MDTLELNVVNDGLYGLQNYYTWGSSLAPQGSTWGGDYQLYFISGKAEAPRCIRNHPE